ncbi:MAG: DUF2911 domain-containing protein [Chryseolinea sp.]
MKKILMLALMIYSGYASDAQIDTPAASPAGSVSTTVGLTEVKIDYSRPRTKGRKIFGDGPTFLTPYGKAWRTGANGGTKITFSDDVKVEGIAVPKGEYLILTWPGATEWTVSLYKDIKLGGNVSEYNAAQDAAKFKVKAEKLADRVEQLTFSIGDLTEDNKTAKVQLAWENTSVKFGVTVDFDSKVMASIDKTMAGTPDGDNYFAASVYYLETDRDLKKALDWMDKSLAAQKDGAPYWMLYQKARIQKGLGNKAGAIATATASKEAAAKAKNADYEKMNDTLITSLK